MKQIDNKDMEHLFVDANNLLSNSEMYEIKAGKAGNSSQSSKPCKICVGCVIAAAVIIL